MYGCVVDLFLNLFSLIFGRGNSPTELCGVVHDDLLETVTEKLEILLVVLS
jgi:hypothetical protein